MKVVNIVTYIQDADQVAAARPAHRAFMAQLRADGRLTAGGPFDDGTGALFIYDVADLAEAERIVAEDPYSAACVIAHHVLKPWTIILANPEFTAPDR